MSRDSHISYLHLTKSHHSLYLANWVRDRLPHGDIEVPHVDHLLYEDDDSDIPTNAQTLSLASTKCKRKGGERAHWRDLNLQKFLDEEEEEGDNYGKSKNDTQHLRDMTILKRLDISESDQISSVPQKNIFSATADDSFESVHSSGFLNRIPRFNGNEGINLNSVDNNISSDRNTSGIFTTPEIIRKKPTQRTFSSSFKTPTPRNLR